MAWLTGWDYRKEITITNNVASELTNFQVPIDLDLLEAVEAGKAKADLTDLRVTDSDGETLLDFYREYLGNEITNENNWWRWNENPILQGGASAWDDWWIQPDSIIQLADETYRLYYSGSGVTGEYTDEIGYATSPDGITLTKYGSNPIFSAGAGGQWDQGGVSHFVVIRDGSNWYAWYAGHDTGGWEDGGSAIGYATSADGISWTRDAGNPVLEGSVGEWDAAFVVPSHVFEEGGTYYMFYWGGTEFSGGASGQSTWKIGLATSTDRVTWTKHGSNPILSGTTSAWDDGVLEPFVVKIGATYYMFYQGNSADQSESAIGVATASSLTGTWTKDGDNPFPRGANSSEWDWLWHEAPKLIQMGDGTWNMYYMGNRVNDTSTDRMIGLFKFKPTRLWVEVPTIPSSSTATVYVYYGNSGASDASNGANTFTFFEDFTGGTPFSQWTNSDSYTGATVKGDEVAAKTAANASAGYYLYTTSGFSPPFVAECRAAVGADWDNGHSWNYRLDLTDVGGGIANAILTGHFFDASNNLQYLMRFVSGSATHNISETRDIDALVFTTLTLRVPSSGAIVGEYNDGYRSQSTASTTPPADPLYVQLVAGRSTATAYTTYFDKVWVRKYAATEPSTSEGGEEEDPAASFVPRSGVAIANGVMMV